MSILASIKQAWGHGDDEEEYADDETLESDDAQAPATSSKYASGYGGGDGSSSRARSLRSVPIPMRAREKNIYTLRPKNQDEAAIAADYLKSGSAVVMNLETVEKSTAIRIIDFMSGVCYGLEGQGHAMKLGDSIFLFTPAEFEISSDELDYGENRDFFFKDVDKSVAPQAPNQPLPPQATRASQPLSSGAQPSTPASGQRAGSVLLPPATNTQGPTTSSGYATADYSAPHAPSRSQPAMTVTEPASAPAVQASTLPSSSVYSSSGKAHVLIGGKPANVNPAVSGASSSPQSSYQSSERRSWER